MAWRVRYWCGDCRFNDSMGCFDGGTEVDEDMFPTREAAEEHGEQLTDGLPWDYEVFESEGS